MISNSIPKKEHDELLKGIAEENNGFLSHVPFTAVVKHKDKKAFAVSGKYFVMPANVASQKEMKIVATKHMEKFIREHEPDGYPMPEIEEIITFSHLMLRYAGPEARKIVFSK